MNKIAFLLAIIALISIKSTAQTEVKFYTTKGDFVVELNDSLAPITTTNFKDLVKEKYYDGVLFHRVIDNFMIQGGQGATTKPTIKDEFHASLSNVTGTISMANTGAANSGTSQFFINLIDNTRLDFNKAPFTSKHAVFGKVTENFSVVQTIGKVPTTPSPPASPPNNKPLTDVVMDSLRIVVKPTSIAQSKASSTLDDFVCYPNPIQHNSVINLGQNHTTTMLRLYNTIGNEVAVLQVEPNDLEDVLPFKELNTSNLSPGIYFLEASTISKRKVIRVIVK